MNHEFHFKLDEDTFRKLKYVSERMNIKTMSKTIVVILNHLLPDFEKNQIEFHNKKSRYRKIADPKYIRSSIHAYILDDIYRQLKSFHQYFNYYSLAQILREIIEIFIRDFMDRPPVRNFIL